MTNSGELLQYRPLCSELYTILQRRFGSIKVACPGEGFLADGVRDAQGRLRLVVHSGGEYYRVNCFVCHDTRHRLWISHMYGARDADGRRMTHLAHCYNENCLSDYNRRRELEEMLLGLQNRLNRQRQMYIAPGTTEYAGLFAAPPPGTLISVLDLPPQHKAVQYLMSTRGYSPQTVFKYGISYCVEAAQQFQPAYDRLVFPIWFNNMLVGWQCRFIGDIDFGAAGVPKYYSMPGFHKRLVLYNYDTAAQKQFVVVVEGTTDVHALGDHGAALLGKTVSQHQRRLLLNIGPGKPILFMLDPEARDEMAGIINEITLSGAASRNPVLQIELPGTLDPGDYRDRLTLWNIIQTQARQRGVLLQFTS